MGSTDGSSGVPGGCSRRFIVSYLISATCDGILGIVSPAIQVVIAEQLATKHLAPTARNTGRAFWMLESGGQGKPPRS
jgi:hypothetical protein